MSQEVAFSLSDKGFGGGSPRENLRAFRNHGFTHIHFSRYWSTTKRVTPGELEEIRADMEDSGMRVLDVHGYHTKEVNLWNEDGEGRSLAFDLFRHRLEVTRALGGDAVVYHVPTRVEPTDALIGRFVDGLARLEDTARELGIKVALENHFVAENDKRALAAAFEHFSDDYLGFTLDTGHANRSGNLDWLLRNCCDRLFVLHLNDNDVKEDRHWLPRQDGGSVDWAAVSRAIAAAPYQKPLQLEVRWDEALHATHAAFLQDAAREVSALHEEIERRRAGAA